MDNAIHQVVIATTMSPHLGLCSSGDLLDLMHSFFVCQEIKHPDLLAITFQITSGAKQARFSIFHFGKRGHGKGHCLLVGKT